MTTTLLNNRYQVIQVLSAGGFGETFLAEDTYMPSRRRCVIKQLKPIANDPQTYNIIQQRFEREAATLEYLGEASNQIPKLYAYFSENGQFYLVQEWIHGPTLTEIIKAKGSLSETAVREILLSLLSVLDYVHSKGIIHRDIKPDNILLRHPPASNTLPNQGGVVGSQPILIDFGAVKETIRSVVNTPGHLTKSLVIGTPGYMSSEQAVGRPVYASDIYSLGLTAIYLLTGKHPHELQTNPQTGEIFWQHHASGVSQNLVIVLNQAIKPYASDRYTTASKMLYALQSAGSTIPPTSMATTQPTVALSPVVGQSHLLHQQLSSHSNTPVIPASSTSGNWQKPIWIVGSLFVGGLIGAVAIASMHRQPVSEAPIDTSPTLTSPPSESNTTNQAPSLESPTPKFRPTKKSFASRRLQTSIAPTRIPQEQLTPTPSPTPVGSDPQIENEPENSATSTFPATSIPLPEQDHKTPPSVSIPLPEQDHKTPPSASIPLPGQDHKTLPATPETSPTPQNENTPRSNPPASTTSKQEVPAFPTGTTRSTVEKAIGKPTKDSRGIWNTRAVSYKLVPHQIDLGYLFDPRSGELRQTEVGFAQSVDPQVMQTTLEGMLGGEATEKIKQGLQQVQQRRSDNFRFTQGSLKGQIVRQDCDFIYISIWNKDLHDFVSPSQDRRC